MRTYYTFLLLLITFVTVDAQMTINGQVMYGNEWIDYSAPHIEIKVAEDGLYRLTYQQLVDEGFSASDLKGSSLQIFNNGLQIDIFVSSEEQWSTSDFLIFYGESNDAWLDSHGFEDPENDQLNTEVSMFSENRSYFVRLKADVSQLARYTEFPNDLSGNLPVLRTHYVEREMVKFKEDTWNIPTPAHADIHFSHFATVDGWSTRIRETNIAEIPVSNLEDEGPDPTLRIRIGANKSNHQVEVEANNNTIFNEVFAGVGVKEYTFEILFLM